MSITSAPATLFPNSFEARPRAVFVAALIGMLATVNATRAVALEVKDPRWGFDGTVMHERFNLLSMRIENPGTEAFDGEIVLRKHRGLDPVDAPIVESIYLAPGAGRWIQFYAYIDRPTLEVWVLTWGKGTKNRAELPQTTSGRDAAVVLAESGNLTSQRVGARIFPEELFPTRATACDALAKVVLDHEPRWNDNQQKAFLDWLKLGGEVHVVLDSNRKFPRFSGTLDVLSDDSPRRRYGAGAVFHHDLPLNSLDGKTFRNTILRKTEPEDESAADDGAEPIPVAPQANSRFFTDTEIEVDGALLRQLKGLTRAEHNWVLIHLLSLIFLLLVFPGCWKLGQERLGDYRLVFGSLLGVVTLFSLAFLYIGSRGAGEATAVDTLILARPIDDKRFDVSGWSNGFVVAGGDYTFTHAGAGRIYSTGQSEEDVRGTIRNGPEAGIVTDMPPFSARTLLYRITVEAPPIQVAVNHVSRAQELRAVDHIERKNFLVQRPEPVAVLQKLELVATGEGLPKSSLRAAAVYGRLLYPLNVKVGRPDAGGGMVFELQNSGQMVATFLKADQGMLGMQPWNYEQPHDRRSMFDSMFERGVQRSLGLLMAAEAIRYELPTDRIRVLIFCDLPEAFRLKSEQFGSQYGRCMYSIDVPLGDAP